MRNTSENQNPISRDFALSIHVVPAAYPRATPFVPLPSASLVNAVNSESSVLSKEERKKLVKKVTDEIMSLKARHIRNGDFAPDEKENRVLWSCVTRYYRKSGVNENSGKRSITLLLLHATGFPKEVSFWFFFLQRKAKNQV